MQPSCVVVVVGDDGVSVHERSESAAESDDENRHRGHPPHLVCHHGDDCSQGCYCQQQLHERMLMRRGMCGTAVVMTCCLAAVAHQQYLRYIK